ncbi:MAG: hypothetical protein U0325_19645 [Polyangiales bacterium]
MRRLGLPLALTLHACATAPTPPARANPRDVPVARWSGTARYESRSPTPQGASAALERRPARSVRVVALADDGTALGETLTDDEGRYTLDAPANAAFIALRAEVTREGFTSRVSVDGEWQNPHELRVRTTGPGTLDLLAADAAPGGPAGAFHIADTVLRGADAVRGWTARPLPPLTVYWGRGVTSEWSYYRGERPARSGRFMLELMGGNRGQQRTSDCDEHDEGIILHEFGHFVMDRLSTNSSTGGTHPSGHLIDAGLAWEEGRATWLSAAVRREPRYQDTIGIEPQGSLRVDHAIERGDQGPRGVGSETSVSDILWDLTDGVDGYPDEDHDGVALGPAPLLRVMMEFSDEPGAYPSLATFLRRITEAHGDRAPLLSRDELLAMLRRVGQPESVLTAEWPVDLAVPGEVRDRVDGLTSPAPSGGPPRGGNGFDALRVYRVHLTQRGWLRLELRIDGTGAPQDRTDVDLELRDMRGDMIVSAAGTGSVERIARLLQPGYYMVYVRDGGDGARGNRAGFTLRTTQRVLPPEG